MNNLAIVNPSPNSDHNNDDCFISSVSNKNANLSEIKNNPLVEEPSDNPSNLTNNKVIFVEFLDLDLAKDETYRIDFRKKQDDVNDKINDKFDFIIKKLDLQSKEIKVLQTQDSAKTEKINALNTRIEYLELIEIEKLNKIIKNNETEIKSLKEKGGKFKKEIKSKNEDNLFHEQTIRKLKSDNSDLQFLNKSLEEKYKNLKDGIETQAIESFVKSQKNNFTLRDCERILFDNMLNDENIIITVDDPSYQYVSNLFKNAYPNQFKNITLIFEKLIDKKNEVNDYVHPSFKLSIEEFVNLLFTTGVLKMTDLSTSKSDFVKLLSDELLLKFHIENFEKRNSTV